MEVRDIRLQRLKALLSESHDSQVELSARILKAPAQISQWLHGVRTISEESAREIEAAAKKPRGWMDNPIYSTTPAATKMRLYDSAEELVLTREEFELILRIRDMVHKH